MFHTKRRSAYVIAAAFRSRSEYKLRECCKNSQEKLTFGRNGAFIGVDKRRKKKGATEGTEIEKFIDTIEKFIDTNVIFEYSVVYY
jgi:hypothetical protein